MAEEIKLNKMPFESSTIIGHNYDEKKKILHIGFASKTGMVTYSYSNVPKETVEEFLASGSHGKYFHAHIKDKFETIKL